MFRSVHTHGTRCSCVC